MVKATDYVMYINIFQYQIAVRRRYKKGLRGSELIYGKGAYKYDTNL